MQLCIPLCPCCAQLQNAHLGPKLREMGLTPENAFGCVMEFVFPPKPDLYRRVIWTESGRPVLDTRYRPFAEPSLCRRVSLQNSADAVTYLRLRV